MKSKLIKSFISYTTITLTTSSLLLNIAAAADHQVKLPKVINGIIIKESTLVPLRDIFENLGATIEWDDLTKKITATKDAKTIVLTVGDIKAYVNDQLNILPVAPQIINEKTMIPARFVSESFEAKVEWDSANNVVNINDSIQVVFGPDAQTINKLLSDANQFYINILKEDFAKYRIDYKKADNQTIAKAYEARKKEFSKYLSDNFINGKFSEYYSNSLNESHPTKLPVADLIETRLKVNQVSENSLLVEGISLPDMLSDGASFEIKLIKKDDNWLIEGVTYKTKVDDLKITESEATKFLEARYATDSKITFLQKVTIKNDPYLNGEYYKYQLVHIASAYTQYIYFNTKNGTENVVQMDSTLE
ncbi:copper amine oxidase N-terminal domain-containing protein [Paenibacillus sp. WQ 127069]|uniref:Copper amine oxidase N-terminal domain-containing protein n=1 Tax=Paenibacillus baimaensis TaxID=2982185 RepID=A0ABT2UQA3_9BACL|nr:copper amine oxidase N-terminal domain-containing protein [Paenibacillus sp. WQ 127069]MCU6796221.1 copper amine oxidase N-terminal domain-containing protein [Paenibacillus sp. WQ 127069]